MDTSEPTITFDSEGICNHCHTYDRTAPSRLKFGTEGQKELQEILRQMKEAGRNKPYDCVLGLSGGVDSSYAALAAKRLGLRVLAVHFDNGWNSELAVQNIENLVKKLGFDYETYVVDWEEFKSLQLAYFRASVMNIEVPTDHAINATICRTAAKYGIRYIITGGNFVTEGNMPPSWAYNNKDLRNLVAINRKFGGAALKTFPKFGLVHRFYYEIMVGLKSVRPLYYVPYVKTQAIQELQDEVGWRSYPVKHGESVFTRFYQCYILPRKFQIDKRRAHYSMLICSKQLSREDALAQVQHSPYEDPKLEAEDKAYIIKKFGLTEDAFEELMRLPVRSHYDYPNSAAVLQVVARMKKALWPKDFSI